MSSWLERTELLIGSEAIEKLKNSHVLVVGLGGVGSFAAEFLVRAGVGKLTIVDGDIVDPTNKNRQLPALTSTHGQSKAALMAQRILDINPDIELESIAQFMNPTEMEDLVNRHPYDFVMDCIDSVQPKLNLISLSLKANKRLISSMGAGGRIDPSKLEIADIRETYNCTFARHLRKRLKREYGISTGFPTVFSHELPNRDSVKLTDGTNYKKSFYGTISYIPAAFGLFAASYVIRELSK